MVFRRIVAMVVVVLVHGAMAYGGMVTISPTKDNTIYQSSTGSLSNGSGQYLFAGRTGASGGNSRRRALVQFDIAGNIPAGSTITQVMLTMHMSRTAGGSSSVELHRVLADWGEGTSHALGQEGTGALATPGDATWINSFFDTNNWATPGGDFTPTSSAVKTITGLGNYAWSSTNLLISDVQSWLDQPTDNFGWMLIGTELFGMTAKRFDSRENSIQANRPSLTIQYVPEPSTCCLFLAATGILVLRSRRRRIVL